jgi:hypothetical protein
MTDVETTLRAELNRMLVVDAAPDWGAVLVAAGVEPGAGKRRQRRLAVAFAALLAVAVVALVTPLGGAIARGLDEFSTWLTGDPGTPVSEEEQRAFDQETRRWRVGLPAGTELRRLITRQVGDSTVELLGVRSGERICLRLRVSGATAGGAFECAPLAELRRAGGPVRVLIADHGVGRGDKEAWLGTDRYVSNKLRISAGVAADGVDAVELRDLAGRHEVTVQSNAFLYIAEDPEVKQRVREVWARTPAGLVAVPFAPVPTVFGSARTRRAAPPAPPVEREVSDGSIGWLEDREPRGEPLDAMRVPSAYWRLSGGRNVIFGRVVTPDPSRPYRVLVALNAHKAGGGVVQLCTFGRGGNVGGGSCGLYPGYFEHSPVNFAMSAGGPGAFDTVYGLASDDVARLEVLLADGTTVDVPLADNAFIVDVPRAALPGRVVAYDSEGRVISSSMTLTDPSSSSCCVSQGPGEPAPGKPDLLWHAEGPSGSYAELSVGPSTLGDECMYLKVYADGRKRAPNIQCRWQSFARSPVQVNNGWRGWRKFVNGRVRDDVKSVRIRFADGKTVVLKPRRGYVLYALPADRFTGKRARRAVGADGLDASGNVVGSAEFRHTRGR